MFVPVPDAKADGEAQRELPEVGIEEARMKSDELIEDYCFDATDNQTKAVYPKADVDAIIDELKASEDVLVTDNRDLLEKVKMLEERLLENAGHFKRNEEQILENADKVIAEKDKEIQRLENLCVSYRIDCDNLAISNEHVKRAARTLLKKMNHNKRKRCLAMADYAEAESCYHTTLANGFWLFRNDITKRDEERRIAKRWDKWQNRWLDIADKFKEGV